MVEVEQCALGTFEQDLFARAHRSADQALSVTDEGLQGICGGFESSPSGG
jgi:hypothetical protein